ncbi:MAG: hypothetical protein WD076_07540, partial [Parvularculaceae bacterium]
GKVVKSEKGWGVGVHAYEVIDEARWMSPGAGRIASVVSHQDQVVDAPRGAKRLAGSDFCPNAVLAYAQGPAISFQMHPEFAPDFAADLLRSREERLPRAVVEEGLSTLKQPTDRALIAKWIATFFLSS